MIGNFKNPISYNCIRNSREKEVIRWRNRKEGKDWEEREEDDKQNLCISSTPKNCSALERFNLFTDLSFETIPCIKYTLRMLTNLTCKTSMQVYLTILELPKKLPRKIYK